MNTAEYLARVGFDYLASREGLRNKRWNLGEDDDADDFAREVGIDQAKDLRLHEAMRQLLIDKRWKPEPRANGLVGAKWLGLVISWPDRLNDLKTWAGQMTLPKIISQRRASLARVQQGDVGRISLFDWMIIPQPKQTKRPKGDTEDGDEQEGKGQSGIDSLTCQNARDIGFSPGALDMRVAYRPGLELLAIIGLQLLPLITFGPRLCGFVHANRVWQFPLEPRDGGYLYRWGDVKEFTQGDLTYNQAAALAAADE